MFFGTVLDIKEGRTMSFKQELFTQFARVGKALSNGNRLELLEFLAQGERSVDQLSKVAGLTVANTSQHLQQLRHAGMVSCRKQGLKVYYSISGDDVIVLLDALRTVAERHVSDVEGGPVPAVQVKVDVVDNVPARGAVERVAQCAAQNEAVRKAFRFAQRPGEQPCEPCRYCERDRQKKPPLPAARASKEAERRAGIESVN